MLKNLRSWHVLFASAADFFTVELRGLRGLVTFFVLLVIELSIRRAYFAGVTPNPNTAWTTQAARNSADPFDGFVRGKRFLILDRDRKYSCCPARQPADDHRLHPPVRR